MAVTDSGRIEAALKVVMNYGGIDGGHHKQWVLDQVVRALTGAPESGTSTKYERWKKEYSGDPEDEENYYGEWDEGIAP